MTRKTLSLKVKRKTDATPADEIVKAGTPVDPQKLFLNGNFLISACKK